MELVACIVYRFYFSHPVANPIGETEASSNRFCLKSCGTPVILLVVVHPANIQDRDGAKLLLKLLSKRFGWLKVIWADAGYAGKLIDWVKCLHRHRKIRLEIVKRNHAAKGFEVLPKRWIVERTFGWLSKSRRLSKDFETNIDSSVAVIHIAMIRLMIARIAR